MKLLNIYHILKVAMVILKKKGTTNIYVYIKLAYLYDVNIGYLLGITKNIVHLTEEEKKIIALKYNVNNYLKDKIGIINYDIPRK